MADLTKLIEAYARLYPDFPAYSLGETARILASFRDTPFRYFSAAEISAELVTNFKHLFVEGYTRYLVVPSWWALEWAQGRRGVIVASACEQLGADANETQLIEEYLTRYFEENEDAE